MDTYEQLETDVFYLALKKHDFAAAWSRIDTFAAQATGLDAGRVLWLRGILLREEGRLAEATSMFETAEELLSADTKLLSACLLDCAAIANRNGHLDAAERAEKRLLQLAQRHSEARVFKQIMYGNIGDTHYLRGDVTGAVDWYRDALKELSDPYAAEIPNSQRLVTMALLWHRLVTCYLDLGDPVRARFAIEGVRQSRHPVLQGFCAFDEFHINLRTGKLAEAERWLDEADSQIQEPAARQHVLLGRIWLAEARGDEAAARHYVEQLYQEHDLVMYEIRLQLDKLHIVEPVAS